jgi:hypothetical protein
MKKLGKWKDTRYLISGSSYEVTLAKWRLKAEKETTAKPGANKKPRRVPSDEDDCPASCLLKQWCKHALWMPQLTGLFSGICTVGWLHQVSEMGAVVSRSVCWSHKQKAIYVWGMFVIIRLKTGWTEEPHTWAEEPHYFGYFCSLHRFT